MLQFCGQSLTPPSPGACANARVHPPAAGEGNLAVFEERTGLFEELIKYFPKDMKQPQSNLVDLIPMDDDV